MLSTLQSCKNTPGRTRQPLTNIKGFGSGNSATMMGHTRGFQALLKKDLPSVFVLGCVCHSFVLCANYASKCLPSFLESFLKNVTSYFSKSNKRLSDFHLIQNAVKLADHQILKLSQTCWLSRGKCYWTYSGAMGCSQIIIFFFQSEEALRQTIWSKWNLQGCGNWRNKTHVAVPEQYLKKINEMNIEFQTVFQNAQTIPDHLKCISKHPGHVH